MPALVDFLPKVYEITNRPDLVAETTSFLTRSLKRAHNSGEYNFDIFDQDIAYAGSLSFSEALPARFKKYYSVTADERIRLHEVGPSALFDDLVQMEKRNTFYIVGTNIVVKMTDAFEEITHKYVRQPTWDDSYIATNYEEAIVYHCASMIFDMMGNQAAANRWRQQAEDVYAEITKNHFIP